MKIEKSERGFESLLCLKYDQGEDVPIVSQSSAIGDYEDSFEKPGSSYLWVGEDAHLDREGVQSLVNHLRGWLKTGKLSCPVSDTSYCLFLFDVGQRVKEKSSNLEFYVIAKQYIVREEEIELSYVVQREPESMYTRVIAEADLESV